MKKGYRSEYLAKQKLCDIFGKQNVIKVAIGGAQDFIVLQKGRVVKFVEVKECHKNKFSASARERTQFDRIKDMALEHGCSFELWIHYPHKRDWSTLTFYG
jgi:penicillin-binding protein-related factor A (putative recombinase)